MPGAVSTPVDSIVLNLLGSPPRPCEFNPARHHVRLCLGCDLGHGGVLDGLDAVDRRGL